MLVMVAGCASRTDGPAGEGELTKEEVRAKGGKADDGTDYCEWFGWYGDGICDDFCPHPDPDCGPVDAGGPGCEAVLCAAHTRCLMCNGEPNCVPIGEECPAVDAGSPDGGAADAGGPDAGDHDGGAADAGLSCEAQDARGSGPCTLFHGYAWNGTTCTGVSGCSCHGADCDDLYDTPEACEHAYSECVSDCRETGCPDGRWCTFCWVEWQCIPEGAVC